MSKGLSEAQEYLAVLDRAIAKDECETRDRVVRCTGLDGDADHVSRQEWQAHHDRVAPLRAQREEVVKALVAVAPLPTIIIPSVPAALASRLKED